MGNLPSGTVTFLFTDIEGSTGLAQQYPDSIAGLLHKHHSVLRNAIEAHNGYIFHVIGDAFCSAFQTVREALDAALEAQYDLTKGSWEPPIRVRMGISTGSAQVKLEEGRPPDYSGYLSLARAQRVMSVAYGGQILLANVSGELVRGELPPNVSLKNMGEHRLKSLLNPERLWQAIGPGLQAEFPALKSLNGIPNNLPLQLTSFIGRERELADVKELLDTHRLVTLTGAGGTGKSRLSLQVAADLLDQFHNGIWFVELAPVTDPTLISQSVIRVLGLTADSAREPLEILKEFLADRSLLLILDNCEHLLDAACQFADAILKTAPDVKIMPTSREALNLAGEQAYRVPSLSQPDINHLPPVDQLTQFEAVRLFIERASLVLPKFAVTNSNAPAVAQICHRLDGIPLAIELAAARVKSMPLDAIVSHLDDRFRLLTGGSRAALPRQQTLRAMIDWSYALLSEPEKLLLKRLSVFRGGRTLEAAEAVCSGEGIEQADILDLMSRLVGKSLLYLDERGRYRMLETVRQYAAEKMIESEQAEWARDQHLKYMLELAEKAEPEVRGSNQLLWLDRLDAEVDNLRAAIAWAHARDAELFLRLASALWWFWYTRIANSEGIQWLSDALEHTEPNKSVVRAQALGRAAMWYSCYDNEKLAEQFGRQAYALGKELGDEISMAMGLESLGDPLADDRKTENRVTTLKQALGLSLQVGNHWLAASALNDLAFHALNQNDPALARSLSEQALQEARRAGDRRLVSSCLRILSYNCQIQGDGTNAERLVREALSLAQEISDRRGIWNCTFALAEIAILQEDYAEAQRRLEEAYRFALCSNMSSDLIWVFGYQAILHWALGNLKEFRQCAESDMQVARKIRWSLPYASYLLAEAYRLTEASNLARQKYTEALVLARDVNNVEHYCYCFQGLGAIALTDGKAERAARLFGARAKLRPTVRAEDYYPFMVRQREKQLAEARAQLGEEAFSKAWAEGQAMSQEEMLAYAMEDAATQKEAGQSR